MQQLAYQGPQHECRVVADRTDVAKVVAMRSSSSISARNQAARLGMAAAMAASTAWAKTVPYVRPTSRQRSASGLSADKA